jgi:hypothetical protein
MTLMNWLFVAVLVPLSVFATLGVIGNIVERVVRAIEEEGE